MGAGLRLRSSFCRFQNRAYGRTGLRAKSGSALSEAGPALFLLLMFAIFPVIDIIYFGVSYYSVVTLNDLQLREACKISKSEAISPTGPVIQGVPARWLPTALGGLARLSEPPATEVSYSLGESNVYVSVNTKVSIEPLLKIPFLAKIPGLGAPVVISVGRTKLMENPNEVFR